MIKYVEHLLRTAKSVGVVKTISMDEASTYYPAQINISGTTEDDQKFILTLTVGERKNADS